MSEAGGFRRSRGRGGPAFGSGYDRIQQNENNNETEAPLNFGGRGRGRGGVSFGDGTQFAGRGRGARNGTSTDDFFGYGRGRGGVGTGANIPLLRGGILGFALGRGRGGSGRGGALGLSGNNQPDEGSNNNAFSEASTGRGRGRGSGLSGGHRGGALGGGDRDEDADIIRPYPRECEWDEFIRSVRDYPKVDVLGLQKNLYFLTHSVPETSNRDETKSHANQYKSEFPVQLANYLRKQGYDGSQIKILYAYDIRQRMSQCFGTGKSHGIWVDSVYNYYQYQRGRKCDIIILSLFNSNNPISNTTNANHVCVAMSLAKLGVYIFGSMDLFKKSLVDGGCIGTTLPIVCQKHGKTQEISSPEQFDQLAPDGGCAQPCRVRMVCGHQCPMSCHAFNPEHKKIKCHKKCARKCPEGMHGCLKLCFEKCDPCSEIILRQLPCGHSQMAKCHLNFEKLECTGPCELKLSPCGHRCINQCGQKCTLPQECTVPTEKMLRCGHTIILKCHEDPLTLAQQCQQEVQKCWPNCGHESSAKCHEDPALLPCLKPCLVPLAGCGHQCAGTCGQCRQGRLHLDCAKDCNRILICGHECRSKCSTVCPPCPLPCETACIHSTCSETGRNGKNWGRQCGERCTPCTEQCVNGCDHQRCTKLCSEPCNIEPCMEPCPKPLRCSIGGQELANDGYSIVHPCIGICGEKCLDICAICNPEKFAEIKEIFLGREDKEGARFLQLQDCGHIFEAQDLDEAIHVQLESQSEVGDAAAIVVIKCPRCTTPIRRSNRYIKLLNERAMQIDKVKKKLLGDKSKEQLLADWDHLKKALMKKDILLSVDLGFSEINDIYDAFEKIRQAILNVPNNEINGHWMVMAENIDRLLLGFSQTVKRICDFVSKGLLDATDLMMSPDEFPHLHNAYSSTIRVDHLLHYLIQDLCELIENLASRNVRNVADSTLIQLSSELGRHNFLITIFKWIGTTLYDDIDEEAEQMLTGLLSDLQTAQAFGERKEELEKKLDDLVRHMREMPLSKEEMVVQIKAVGANVTRWYTCSKGHVYGIGECGQPDEESKCIHCKETVGGTSHNLVSTSKEAAELNWDSD